MKQNNKNRRFLNLKKMFSYNRKCSTKLYRIKIIKDLDNRYRIMMNIAQLCSRSQLYSFNKNHSYI